MQQLHSLPAASGDEERLLQVKVRSQEDKDDEEDETPVRDIIPPPDIPDEVFLRVLGFWYTV